MNEERLIELETKFSHQLIAIEDLQNAALLQQRALDNLEKAMNVLKQRLDATISGDAQVGPGNEKPPHY